jgi:capsular polysaccharide transport system ATP-binding protein
MCQAGAVLENGQLTYHDRIDDAITHHVRNMNV